MVSYNPWGHKILLEVWVPTDSTNHDVKQIQELVIVRWK